MRVTNELYVLALVFGNALKQLIIVLKAHLRIIMVVPLRFDMKIGSYLLVIILTFHD